MIFFPNNYKMSQEPQSWDIPSSDRIAQDKLEKESMPSRELEFRPKENGNCTAGKWVRGSQCATPVAPYAPFTMYKNGADYKEIG